MSVWFTADTHFGHKNVIGFCNRPYTNVDEMNEDLIAKWNDSVQEGDTIYHLGDFAFLNKVKTREIIERLNGDIILLKGNHDANRKKEFFLDCGMTAVYDLGYGHTLEYFSDDDEVLFEMCHYPVQEAMGDYDQRDYLLLEAPPRSEVPGVLVHGHVHQQWRMRRNMVNVGCDVWGLKPVSLRKLLACVKYVRTMPYSIPT